MSAQPTSNSQSADNVRADRLTLGYILISVISYGLIPPVIGYIGGEQLPFFFLSAWRVGVAVSCVAVLIVFYLPLWLNKGNWSEFKDYLNTSKTKAVDWPISIKIRQFQIIKWHPQVSELRIPLLNWKIPGDFIDWRILLCILGNCEYALLAWSFRFIDISVATILFQSWSLFSLVWLIVTFQRSNENSGRQSGKSTISLILLISLGFIGFAFVIASQTGELGELGNIPLLHLVIGIILAVSAVALGQLKNWAISWTRNLNRQLSNSLQGLGNSPAMFFVVVSFLISSLGAAVIGAIVGLARSETLDMELLGLAFLGGMIVNATAGLLWRKANISDENKTFNALFFATPVLSLLFLIWFDLANISEVDYLILGVMAMVVANLLINFDAEVRWSFEALILALGGCGTLVYFRQDLLELVNINIWYWKGDGYFASIGMTATIFTLLLAFRVARLITRTNDEENRTFNILRKLDHLAKRKVIDGDVRNCILAIDETNKQLILKENYIKARGYIAGANPENQSDRDMLIQVEADLDMLVRSQQSVPVLGEIFALLVFAGITIFLTMFTRPPEPEGWIGMLLDLFAMLVSSVIIFLMMYSMDLDQERDAHILERMERAAGETEKDEEYLLIFPNTEARLFDQWISVTVGVIIIMVYAGLLGHKWLGWFGGSALTAT